MAVSYAGGFNAWLSDKLLKVNPDVDLDVFVSYIAGILDSESGEQDLYDSLLGILAELVPKNDIKADNLCSEILNEWKEFQRKSSCEETSETATTDLSWNVKLQDIISMKTAESSKKVSSQNIDNDHKAGILAQYSSICDEEECDSNTDGESEDGANAGGEVLVKNINALMVKEREKDHREKAKHEAEIKKQKDKEDREKQKQKTLDRKETEKKRTQKGEKKR